jgi:rhodanese-related sulfurtransferase
MSLFSFIARILRDPTRMAPGDFLEQRRPSHPVLDVRTPGEYAGGHLQGALNLNVMGPDFPGEVDRLVREGTLALDRPVYLYCRSGARSGRAAGLLRRRGFEQAWNVGGLRGLKAAGAKVRR